MPTVAILDCNFPNIDIERREVERAGATLRLGQCMTEEQVVDLAADADAIIVQYAPLTARAIGGLERCRVISRYGIGLDNIDVPAASARGIWVTNVPGFCASELAEHTLASLLALGRRLLVLDRSVRRGDWDAVRTMRPTPRIAGLTLGLLGFGQVARNLTPKARAIGLNVIAVAPRTTAETMAEYGARKVSPDELFRESDFLSLHAPLTPETRAIVNARTLALMKPSAFLINTARGGLVDEPALAEALRSGRIAGAALDVLQKEPPTADHPLLGLENVIVTPHASYYSDDSLRDLQTAVAQEVVRVLRGEHPRSAVNADITPRAIAP